MIGAGQSPRSNIATPPECGVWGSRAYQAKPTAVVKNSMKGVAVRQASA